MLYYRGIKSIVLVLFCSHALEKSSATKNNAITVNRKHKFGKNIEVEFNAGGPGLKSHWIGIYPAGKIPGPGPALWLYTCGSQYEDECTEEEVPGEGTVIFRNEAPSSAGVQYFPISAGDYKACLFNEINENEDFTNVKIGKCGKFTVTALKKKKVRKSRLFPTKEKFSIGESIPVNYKFKFAVPNQWIGVYPKKKSYEKKIPDASIWVFSGCGDQFGNQPESKEEQCSKTRKKGTVEFNSTTLESDVPVGEYQVCIVYMWNEPFNRFKCGGSFEVMSV